MKTYYSADELSYLLSQWQGRKIIYELLFRCGAFDSPFAQDRGTLEYNCGAHAIGVELFKDCMTSSPKLTAMMLEEQGNYDNFRTTDYADSRNSANDDDLGFQRY